ncbi:sulfate permease [Candidatus Pseudothioglobus singularis]|uniref:Sulfate permease n=1 Tax=Candidatus Pseudothioglobus singularis PS1 TaxID=1125411 RepID=A0A0M4LNI6_9GAMM|nr:sulfate permease [Candidatus Pseudothioglobus singularis]MDC3294975.1 sulfate permease [bacterium]ALE01359.1 sulfate permease [Candidatus Pseudothioglobus singularis PS1]ANQ66021.1 sulfate permease [Candidatus Pseudothioglobus singularis]MDA9029267.1 sulfate permease [Candidatus Pseudothioglobus singularis]MDC1065592.1 sulfate permease [Candidatus Pseudothioglobus singularis]|tara:strand:+ start:748 stop:2481 length:1734 start_codon:yes stop_codon:yes gene_type:complete
MIQLAKIFPFIVWFRLTTLETIKADFFAGLTGAIIVLPQSVAFATIAGMPPEYGLYTAMVVPIIAALFGSSFHLVSGPTTAISIVVFAAVSKYAEPGTEEFVSLALTLTFLAGVYQLVFGLAKFGLLINFVSHNVVIGFTAGAALLIASSQIPYIVGIDIARGEDFIHTWFDIYWGVGEFNIYLLIVGLGTLMSAILVKILRPKYPNLLIGMLVGGVLAFYLSGLTDTIKTVGAMPAYFPPLSTPDFSLNSLKELAPEAFAIALLGLIEASSIGRSIATKSNQRIDANQEFVGQGASNIVGSFLSSYASSGSFTRSGVNFEAGARTPLSAILAALFLMVIVLLVAPLIAYLPLAAMAGIILLVAYNLVDFKNIRKTFKYSKSESVIFTATFLATLLFELEFAIYLGVLLSLMLFIAKTSTPDVHTLAFATPPGEGDRRLQSIRKAPLVQCPQLKIIRIDMSIYFGSINHIQKQLSRIVDNQRIYHILIVASGVNFIDLAGIEALLNENKRLKAQNGSLYFVAVKSTAFEFMEKVNFVNEIGRENFFDTKSEAIKVLYDRLDKSKCEKCQALVFNECH